MWSDSHTLFELRISLASTTEWHLQNDLSMIREAYNRRDITSILRTSGNTNPADDLKKPFERNGTLAQIIKTNHFLSTVDSWTHRDESEVRTVNTVSKNIFVFEKKKGAISWNDHSR